MLLDLKDICQTLEILRRTRRDLSESDTRNAVDVQIVQLTERINAIVAEDERLSQHKEAEQRLLVNKPKGVDWMMLKATGHLNTMIARVIAGQSIDHVWMEETPR